MILLSNNRLDIMAPKYTKYKMSPSAVQDIYTGLSDG